ncbi:MAG: hypothetical protein KY466_00015 [Gemmatimonadetes bacterium]|nr:hypothetical protein [Gemmatimonadota bacterium]
MFFRRGDAEDDDRLPAKIAIFTVGALLALVGMILQNDWVVGVAALVLAGGIFIRFAPRRDPSDDPQDRSQG